MLTMTGISFSECSQIPQGLLNRMFVDRKSKRGIYMYMAWIQLVIEFQLGIYYKELIKFVY